LEYTRQIHEAHHVLAESSSSHDRGRSEPSQRPGGGKSTDFDWKTQRIISRIVELDAKVQGCRVDIAEIQTRMETHLQEKEMLERQLAQLNPRVDTKGKGKAKGGINYMTEPFDWSEGLKARMKAVFGIQSFRLCQEG
jgi:ATP-dependent DNA helicase Q1